jgi:hypothetical protein
MGSCCSSMKNEDQTSPKIIISNRPEIKRRINEIVPETTALNLHTYEENVVIVLKLYSSDEKVFIKVPEIKPSDRSTNKKNFENFTEKEYIDKFEDREDIVAESQIKRGYNENILEIKPSYKNVTSGTEADTNGSETDTDTSRTEAETSEKEADTGGKSGSETDTIRKSRAETDKGGNNGTKTDTSGTHTETSGTEAELRETSELVRKFTKLPTELSSSNLQIYEGCFENVPTITASEIRIFLSSTFKGKIFQTLKF